MRRGAGSQAVVDCAGGDVEPTAVGRQARPFPGGHPPPHFTARTRVLFLPSDCPASEIVALSVELVPGMADTSRRARWERARRVIMPVAALFGERRPGS